MGCICLGSIILNKLKGYISQNADGSNRISASLIGKDGKEVRRLEVDNVEIKRLGDDRIQLVNNGVLKNIDLYKKNGKLYVFDREGNNFEVVNTYDQVERTKNEIIDKEFIKSQMPGVVVKVLVQEGASVKKGDLVAYLKAMKMEHKIVAPEDTTIIKVLIKEGQFVEAGQPLFKLQLEESPKK